MRLFVVSSFPPLKRHSRAGGNLRAPAKSGAFGFGCAAGVHLQRAWIPAFAGMTFVRESMTFMSGMTFVCGVETGRTLAVWEVAR